MMKKILYFSAEWCGPCKAIKPQMQQISNEVPIQFIDIDSSRQTADYYMIKSVPCVLLIDEMGSVRGRLVGNSITKQSVINLYKNQ